MLSTVVMATFAELLEWTGLDIYCSFVFGYSALNDSDFDVTHYAQWSHSSIEPRAMCHSNRPTYRGGLIGA